VSIRICLVTGGAGFIGSHLVEALVRRGVRVRVLDNLSSGDRQRLVSVAASVEWIDGDVADPATVRQAVAGVECVFHQAALASVPLSVDRPLDVHHACATGTITLLDAARLAGVRRVIYAASSSAYGEQSAACLRESDMPAPVSPYAAAKLAGEYYCRAFFHTYGLETVGLRYFNVYGPRQDPHSSYAAVVPRFITTMLRGQPPIVFGDGRQTRDFIYVEDVVRGNLLAAESPAEAVAGKVFNLASGRATDLLTLIASLNWHLGTAIPPQHDPPRIGDVRDSLADITLARRMLGFDPQVGIDEGLRRSIEYYRRLASGSAGN
jgi:UDP-glucose 4-epimerase